MIRDGVLDDLQELGRRIRGLDGKLVQKLNHQTCKSGKGSRYSGLGVDLDENVVGRMNVDLKQAGSVEGAVEQHEKTLVQNIWPSC